MRRLIGMQRRVSAMLQVATGKGALFFSLCGWLLGSYKRPRSARYFPGTWLERANDRMRQFSLETIWAIMFMGS